MKDWKDLFAESESMDLGELMKRLEDKIPSEPVSHANRSDSTNQTSIRTEELRQWREELNQANLNWNISQYSMHSSRSGWKAGIITLYKRLLEWLIRPVTNVIVFKQAHLNAHFVTLMNLAERRLQSIEKRLEQQESLESRLDERQNQMERSLTETLSGRLSLIEQQMNTVLSEHLSQLSSHAASQKTFEAQLTETLEDMRRRMMEQMEQIVDEISRQFELERQQRHALRRQIHAEFQDELRRMEQQFTESLVMNALNGESWQTVPTAWVEPPPPTEGENSL